MGPSGRLPLPKAACGGSGSKLGCRRECGSDGTEMASVVKIGFLYSLKEILLALNWCCFEEDVVDLGIKLEMPASSFILPQSGNFLVFEHRDS